MISLITKAMTDRRATTPWEVGQCYVTGICSPANPHGYILTNAYDLECELESVNRHVLDALFYGRQPVV
jgi:hypothetical protein